ncbi:aldehyde dehydrogenase family protein [Saccharopolyspora gregorii]|uniref:aldehyde dehydrogenase family protein n=1 Tax=Saccharopolyspora gregorii TaxID=33914 RepID=UPI0021AC7257|nr:aldehyde dehydrogenase family protein [Saccharopolyspora gregorii]
MTGAPTYRMFIDGAWVDAPETYEITSPATDEITARVAFGGVEHADAAVAAAKAAHDEGTWRRMTPEQRADVLDRIADSMEAKVDLLSRLATGENGVTARTAGAFHIGLGIANLRVFAAMARGFEPEQPNPLSPETEDSRSVIRREPIGVCAGIVPFNFPLVLAGWKLGPALAAGNTFVLKCDENTPLTLLELAKSAEEAGLPRGVLNVITGPGETVGDRLAAHPDVRKIGFTGSTEVGKIVQRKSADNLKKVTLELGGKGPNILLDDADLDLAIDGSLFAFLMYSGQVCESGTRLLVPESRKTEIVERLVRRVQDVRIGDPLDPSTDMGPVASHDQKKRVERYVAIAAEEGATVAYRGELPDAAPFDRGAWVPPIIYTDVTNDMRIAREEVFGPVLVVIGYADDADAVRIANDSEYGLSAGVWGSPERALRVADQLEAGTVWVNDWHAGFPMNPFGGYKQSGIGRELGPDALAEYTQVKTIQQAKDSDWSKRGYALVLPPPA